ncbi:MAG: hypothetical protein AAGF97_17195, partial [Planctomycetota bacterium]
YDPNGPTFFHAFFQHQFESYCRRFDLMGSVSPRRDDDDGILSHWDVQMSDVDWDVETKYSLLRWDDLVIRDLKQPLAWSLAKKMLCDLDALFSGMFFRLFRLHWRFGVASSYPTAGVFLLLFVAMMISGGVAAGLSWLGLPIWIGLTLLVPLSLGLFLGGYHLLRKKAFLHLLVADTVFSLDHARGKRQDYLQRLDEFAERVAAAIEASDDDEFVLVGHSSGSFCIVEIMARILRRHPNLARDATPRITMLTVGSILPLIGCHPKASAFREDVTRVAEEESVYWLEYQTPLDFINFPNFDAGRSLVSSPLHTRQMNPTVHNAHTAESMDPKTYQRDRFNIWRLHFQCIMAVDQLVPCDYMMIVAGPAHLELRGSDPNAALQMCQPDRRWAVDAAALQPLMPLPPGRQQPMKPVPAAVS